jgi:anti-sigma factor RsiW
MNVCDRTFDEALLSGYLDGELIQGDEQRVRLHLEGCEACRRELESLAAVREATMTTRFEEPEDRQWSEKGRSAASQGLRRLGWTVLVAWGVAVLVYGGYLFLTGPERPLVKLLVFAGIAGLVMLLLSVVIDRIRDARSDRYRGVQK